MSVWIETKTADPFSDINIRDFLRLRPRCEVRGGKCLGRASQRHHALFGRDRRFPQLDVLINYQAVCENCHTGTGEADYRANKTAFYARQCERYGKAVVDGWIESLPLKDKSF
jgi:hypothetical protein